MAKGVFLGVICVVTVLPAMVLECNNLIEKTKHKEIMPKFTKLKDFTIKHYKLTILIFIIILPIAFYGYQNTDIYYNLDKSLPKTLESITANTDLKESPEKIKPNVKLIAKIIIFNI